MHAFLKVSIIFRELCTVSSVFVESVGEADSIISQNDGQDDGKMARMMAGMAAIGQDDGHGLGQGPGLQPPGTVIQPFGFHPGHLVVILASMLADCAIVLPTRMICMLSPG